MNQQYNHKSYSLSWQLTFSLSFLIFLIVGTVNLFIYFSDLKNAEIQAADRLEKTQSYLEGALVVPIWNMDLLAIQSIIDAAMQDEAMQSIKVF